MKTISFVRVSQPSKNDTLKRKSIPNRFEKLTPMEGHHERDLKQCGVTQKQGWLILAILMSELSASVADVFIDDWQLLPVN